MSTPPIEHPPNPTGATSRERAIVRGLHRAMTTTVDQASVPAMGDGLALLCELIEARNRRQSFNDQHEFNQETAWTE